MDRIFATALQDHQAGRLVEAEQLYRQILERDDRHADALHLLGVISLQGGRHDVALEMIGQAIGINPQSAPYFANLGVTFKALARLDDALRAQNAAVLLQPDFAEAHYNRGNALKDLGRFEGAVLAYRTALRIKPGHAEAQGNLGSALIALGRLDDAIALYRDGAPGASQDGGWPDQDAAAVPDLAIDSMFTEALLAHKAERLSEAAQLYRQILAQDPRHADSLHLMGVVAHQEGRRDVALPLIGKAIALYGDRAAFYANLAVVLRALGRLEEALLAHGAALRLRPDYAEAHYNRGNTLKDLGRLPEAVIAYRTALHINPDYIEANGNLGNALRDMGRLDDAIETYRNALRIAPGDNEAHSQLLMHLHYQAGISGPMILAEARRFGARFTATPLMQSYGNSRVVERRLRIGYVSGDFKRHPVGYFLRPVLENHDPDTVEVFCYCNTSQTDDLSARLQRLTHHWRSVVGMPDKQAASLVARDGIDILIDLSGHTGFNRLPLFGRKPAPVQATWLGFWGTTGVPAIDYILSDAATIPPGAESHFSEQVVRLPGSRFCYAPLDEVPAPAALPCLRSGVVTFGSFNNVSKIGPEVIQLWARVLHAVPGSRLLLKWRSLSDAALRQKLIGDFAAAGIDPARLALRGASPHGELLAEYADVDIALDPFPFSGGLTSCEALWMGVPVISLPGQSAISRQTFGFLQLLGLTELAANSPEHYVRIAAALAANRESLAALRGRLRPLMAGSALCDAARFTRGLESAYRAMWRTWCEDATPTAPSSP